MRLDDGAEVRRTEVPGATVASASTSVASGSRLGPASTMVASGSRRDGAASTIVASESTAAGKKSARVTSSSGGTGTLLLELSPANGDPTPGEAGFRAADFLSDRDPGSTMLRSRDGAKFDFSETPRITHRIDQRELVALSGGVYTIPVLGRALREPVKFLVLLCIFPVFAFDAPYTGAAAGARDEALGNALLSIGKARPHDMILILNWEYAWHES